ncbi:MAG TPA: FHA domain-containing protein, partial [Steroidobacteraceae bacterium]|nr:FHA domain-containing protein [Steroidobacteraceae bacterium]
MDARSLVAVELNDAGIALALGGDGRADVIGTPSPGVAVLQDARVLVGAEAASRQRVTPLHAQNRFWQSLSVEQLPWRAAGIATVADLAHAHLTAVLAPAVRDGAVDALLAVPPGYSREQLGLLVGIANECGVTVRGLVDLGLAACATVPPAPHMLHLDLQLHQATATLVEASRAEGVQRRARYELLPGVGVLAFHQALAESVATSFVQETRFDPLHEATTEQRLHDRLGEWLAALGEQAEVPVEIEFGGMTHRIELQRVRLIASIERLGAELLRLVQGSRPAGTTLHVCVTPRVAALPGFLERLSALRDVLVVTLEPAAGATGALRSASAIARAPEAISLVHRLPLQAPAEPFAAAALASDAVPAEAVPTHVLFRGRAWPLTAVPLTLGWSVGAAPRALTLPAGTAGVSRAHCTLRVHDGQAVVEDQSTYGTFVNDERVGGRVAL